MGHLAGEPELEEPGPADDLLVAFGRNPFSFFVCYDAPWRYLRASDGMVAFLERNGAALVWGDPLGPSEGADALLGEVTALLRARGLRVCLLLVSEETATRALALDYGVLKVGEQPCFDLTAWRPARGNAGKHLRWCLNRAAGAGVRIDAFEPGDEERVTEAVALWTAGLDRPPAESFLRVSPLALADRKRLFVASTEHRLEAVLACSPVPAASGWLLEDLVRRPDAPTGATEALVVEALRALAADGAERAWMDIAPLRGVRDQIDGRARLLLRAARPAIEFFDSRYRFRALANYLGKFRPTSWESRYVALRPAFPTVGLIRAVTSLL